MEKRFELTSTHREVEVRHGHWQNLHVGCTVETDDLFPEILDTFATKEEALKALSELTTSVRYMSNAIPFYDVTEYYVEEVNYDDDGEWESSDCIWEFSRMPLKYDYERLEGSRWCDLSESEKEDLTFIADLGNYSEDEEEEIEIGYHLYITGTVRADGFHFTLDVKPEARIYTE